MADNLEAQVRPIKEWVTPASLYPEVKQGDVEIKPIPFGRGTYDLYNTKDDIGVPWEYYSFTNPVNVQGLHVNGKVSDVDTPPHWWGMCELADQMSGVVVVGGLGLGLFAHAAAKNAGIKKVVIVESNPDMIKLVGPFVTAHKKIQVVQGDWRSQAWVPDADHVLQAPSLHPGWCDEIVRAVIDDAVRLTKLYPDAAAGERLNVFAFNRAELFQLAQEIITDGLENDLEKFFADHNEEVPWKIPAEELAARG